VPTYVVTEVTSNHQRSNVKVCVLASYVRRITFEIFTFKVFT